MGYLTDYEQEGIERAQECFIYELNRIYHKYCLPSYAKVCTVEDFKEDLQDLIIKFKVGNPLL